VSTTTSAAGAATPATDPGDLRERVRAHYAAAAASVAEREGACCGTDCCGPTALETEDVFGPARYDDADRTTLPVAAVAASLGCGNPTAVADLRPGERVLDLGSGGGIDVLLSARRVGPHGFAYGVDMTEEMLALARRNAAVAGATNVAFLRGTIEAVPLPDASVDVVISNCVVNLSTDKAAVLAEAFRVLVPGGRLGISDVVAEDHLTPEQRVERGSWAGCIAGALSFAEYRTLLDAAGFADVSVTPTHAVADGMHAAIVRATRPA
jgi:arsenite methyltransferase